MATKQTDTAVRLDALVEKLRACTLCPKMHRPAVRSFRVEHATRVLFSATRRKQPLLRCNRLRAQIWGNLSGSKHNRRTLFPRLSAASGRRQHASRVLHPGGTALDAQFEN